MLTPLTMLIKLLSHIVVSSKFWKLYLSLLFGQDTDKNGPTVLHVICSATI